MKRKSKTVLSNKSNDPTAEYTLKKSIFNNNWYDTPWITNFYIKMRKGQ